MSNPLVDLESAPWANIQHAYGPASDIPDLLRALTSRDAAAREKARCELCGNIWHQHTVYEATAYAVPFLIRMLGDAQTPDRKWLGTYLVLLYWALTGEPRHIASTRAAVQAGAPTYVNLLRSGTSGEKLVATYLLGAIGQWQTMSDDDELAVYEEVEKAAMKLDGES